MRVHGRVCSELAPSGSLPASSKALTQIPWPAAATWCRGVRISESTARASAPDSSSSLTRLTWPARAAACSAVHPSSDEQASITHLSSASHELMPDASPLAAASTTACGSVPLATTEAPVDTERAKLG
eukprot:scaffold33786_cov124-Isochrysis_galbana.AAC.9